MEKIKVFVSEHCQPCQEIRRLASEGKLSPDVEIVDIESDQGFEDFSKTVLARGDGAVPSAYRGEKHCQIQIDTDTEELIFTCPGYKKDSPEPSVLSSLE